MACSLVITGVGLETSLGRGLDACWEALRAGRSGLGPLRSLPQLTPGQPLQRGGEAAGIEGTAPGADRRDVAHAHLLATCQEALRSARLDRLQEPSAPRPERIALVLGSTLAAQASAPVFWASYLARGPADADYGALRSYDAELRLASLCAALDVRGEALVVANACAASASALIAAADLLRLARADLALVAGFDALDLHTVAGFGAIQALTGGQQRPFGVGRDGMLLGDGYAALALEREDSARARGATPLARLLGFGESSDAFHLTRPDPEGRGAALAMTRALRLGGVEPQAVDAINPHATATRSNDAAEVLAMRSVFGDALGRIPLMASKAAVGHTLGGAGAVEAAITILALRDGVLPPTLGAGELDPELAPLDVVSSARPAPLHLALSNAFGFGGCNASLLLGSAALEPRSLPPVGPAPGSAPARPVITGLGLAAPLAMGTDALWERLRSRTPAVVAAPPTRAGLDPWSAVAFARELEAERYVDPRRVRKASGQARLALVAAALAAEDASLPDDAGLREDGGVVLGTCFGGADYYLQFHEALRRRGLQGANAVLFTEGVFNAAPGHVSSLLGLRGPGLALVGGEEAGLSALVVGADKVRVGAAGVVLAGGAEAFCDLVQRSLRVEGRIGDALANGDDAAPTLLGEGAAVLVLEREADARARCARVYAEVLGVARARGAALPVDPARGGGDEAGGGGDPAPLVRAARLALEQAGLTAAALDLIVGGACGGPGAARERAALRALGAADVPLLLPKELAGEGFAFGSALQAVVGALAVSRGTTPTPSARPVQRALVLAASAPGGAVAVVLGAPAID